MATPENPQPTPPPDANAAPAQGDPAQSGVDPEMACDVTAALCYLALQGGMSPDIRSFAFEFSDSGDATVSATDATGNSYQGSFTAAQIADAIGAEEQGDATEGAPTDDSGPPAPAAQ